MHGCAFVEVTRGLKILIITNSHIKFFPSAPGDIQQLIFQNCIIATKNNFKADDLRQCKVYALEKCVTNYK